MNVRERKGQFSLNQSWAVSRGKILQRKPHVFVKPHSPDHWVTHVIAIRAKSNTALFFFSLLTGNKLHRQNSALTQTNSVHIPDQHVSLVQNSHCLAVYAEIVKTISAEAQSLGLLTSL